MTINFDLARARMVDNQLRTTDVSSRSVLDAFADVPREAFVPARYRDLAYIDEDIEVSPAKDGEGPRYVMEPSPLAKLIQLADIGPDDVVLEIGCGSGYGAAVLSRLASSVVTLECDEDLAEKAAETLLQLGCDNVAVVTGPLAGGHAPEAPYDAILLSGSVEILPQALLDQLRDGGRLVVVEGAGHAARAQLYIRDGEDTSRRSIFNASVKLLPGFAKEAQFVF